MSGIIALEGSLPQPIIEQALESMSHRGPDQMQTHLTGSFQLGQCLLQVTDKSSDRQPIIGDLEGRRWLVYDGHITNRSQLQAKLGLDGSSGESVGEVLLALHQADEVKFVTQLAGAFALAIADEKNKQLFAARDVLGIKPLYYGKLANGSTVFASELKSIYSLTEDIHDFPPGHYYTTEEGFVQYKELQLPDVVDTHSSPEQTAAEVRRLVERAVHKYLADDAEVGLLLSGGLDSSLVASVTCNYRQTRIKSFCVGSPTSSDLPAARQVAKSLGTKHYEYVYTDQELVKALPDVIYYLESFDPSLVRSAIPSYFISRLASDHVKVVLSGEGADELYGGYAYLKSLTNSLRLNAELLGILRSTHSIGLQRADRMTMAHSLEARMPFLDSELLQHAMGIPASLKIGDGGRVEKWILRKAFEGALPESILWRTKAEFSEGSGSVDILPQYAERQISDRELANLQQLDKVQIRSKQEALYYKIFTEFFPQPAALSTVGHWVTT